jgi:hypothetical protein
MTWQPTTRDLETIAELGHARAPMDKIAAELGISPAEFSAWTGRLVAARAPPGTVNNPKMNVCAVNGETNL